MPEKKKDKTGIIIALVIIAILVYLVVNKGGTGTPQFAGSGAQDTESVKYIDYAQGCTTDQECLTKAVAMGSPADQVVQCKENVCYAKVTIEVSKQ
jgi:hypothetical protein